jgi:hypothetical protein
MHAIKTFPPELAQALEESGTRYILEFNYNDYGAGGEVPKEPYQEFNSTSWAEETGVEIYRQELTEQGMSRRPLKADGSPG